MFKILMFLLDLFGWFSIALSPSLIGAIAGLCYYSKYETAESLQTGWVLFGIGVVIGVIWATRVWIYYEPVPFHFINRIYSTSRDED